MAQINLYGTPNYSLGQIRIFFLIPYSLGSDTNLSHPNRRRNRRGARRGMYESENSNDNLCDNN